MIRPLLRFALPFVLGVFLGVYLLPGAVWIPCAAATLFLGLGTAFLWKKYRAPVTVTVIGFSLGLLWLFGYSNCFLVPVQPLVGTEQTMTLTLLEYPERRDYDVQCTARAEGIAGKVMFYGEEALLALEPGDNITVPVRCYSAVEIGGRTVSTFPSKGIFLRLRAAGDMVVEKGEGHSLRYLPQRMKHKLQLTVTEVFAEPTRGLVLALLTGERDSLDVQSESDLEEAGLMHLTAVSGLHCGLLITLVGTLVLGNPYMKVGVAYPVLLFYMMLVGGTPSVVRACVMAAFPLVAPLVDREDDPLTSVSAAALAILLVNPYAVSSVSFQLSFAAILGIILFAEPLFTFLYGLKEWKKRWMRKRWAMLMGTLSGSLCALVFTIPLSAVYFKTISLVAPLSNLLVLPVLRVLFGAALAVSALCMLSPVFSPLAVVVSVLAKYVLAVAGLTAKIPGHGVSFSGWLTGMWLALAYCLLALCLLSGDGRRKYAVAAVLAAVSLFVVRMIPVQTVKDDALTAVSVDVGQGAATLLHSRGVTALVDCGSHYSLRGSGACVVDAMDTYGWEKVDYLILTHCHRDHAGGLGELLARTRVERIMLPPETGEEESVLSREVAALAERYGTAVIYIDDVATLALGTAMVTIYSRLTHGETNEEGLSVLCSAGEVDLLLTGDMGASTEKLLVETYALPDIEVLFVAHHGSKYSTSYPFLRAVTPEVGIISVGDNSYGHPAPEAMERMAYYGMELYRTDWQGNVLIRVHG